MKNIDLFLRKIKGNGVIEISNLYQNLGGLDLFDLDQNHEEESLYFLSFLPSRKWEYLKFYGSFPRRTKEEYIAGKSYVVADFDIRSNVYKNENGRIISNEELMSYLPKIEEGLKSDESLSTYNAIVFSGNGFHVYWIGKPVLISADLYSKATTAIFNRIKEIFKDIPELRPDYAAGNIGRLMRLPGTLNKKEKYGLPPIRAELLYFDKDSVSPLIDKLISIGKWSKSEEEKKVAEEIKKVKDFKPSWTEPHGLLGRGWYEIINEDIKISTLVCKYTGWRLADNGKNFISTINGGYTGAYVIPEENVVVWMGTPHFSDHYKVYSPFSFLMVHYADGDAKRTFQVAKELFPTLHIVSEQYLNALPTKEIQYEAKR